MFIRRAVAVVVSLAMLQATAVAFACSIKCSYVNSTKHVHGGTQLAVHHHSPQGHSSASTCCPTAPQVSRSGCSSDVQLSAPEARYRIDSYSLTAVENPISWVARSERSSPIFSSASPPNSLIRPALTTLRI